LPATAWRGLETDRHVTYKLNHWALSYDSSGNYNANVNIKEAVKLDHKGDSFGGTFSIHAYDPKTGDPLGAEVDGDITGTGDSRLGKQARSSFLKK
jgi:hypothetical protein